MKLNSRIFSVFLLLLFIFSYTKALSNPSDEALVRHLDDAFVICHYSNHAPELARISLLMNLQKNTQPGHKSRGKIIRDLTLFTHTAATKMFLAAIRNERASSTHLDKALVRYLDDVLAQHLDETPARHPDKALVQYLDDAFVICHHGNDPGRARSSLLMNLRNSTQPGHDSLSVAINDKPIFTDAAIAKWLLAYMRNKVAFSIPSDETLQALQALTLQER